MVPVDSDTSEVAGARLERTGEIDCLLPEIGRHPAPEGAHLYPTNSPGRVLAEVFLVLAVAAALASAASAFVP